MMESMMVGLQDCSHEGRWAMHNPAMQSKAHWKLALRLLNIVPIISINPRETGQCILGSGEHSVESLVGVPTAGTVITQGDILVLFGPKKDIRQIMQP